MALCSVPRDPAWTLHLPNAIMVLMVLSILALQQPHLPLPAACPVILLLPD